MAKNPSIRQVFTHPVHLLAFGFGSGLAPKAPGTVGTLPAIPIYLLLQPMGLMYYSIGFILLCLFSIYIAGKSARLLGVHDHSGIVIDEICGCLLVLWFVPDQWLWIVAGFIIFRGYDIVKPWPINYLDRHVGGGFGIVLDDLMAGIYAALSIEAIHWLLRQFSSALL